MENDSRCLVLTFVIINSILVTADTTTQIMHYKLTNWSNQSIKDAELMFILLRPILHTTIFLIYIFLHCEPILTISKKLATLPIHIVSVYTGYTPWVHLSFYSKYYLESENGIVIAKIVNAFAFVFVSLPKLLIIPINSSAIGKWNGIDIVSLIFSILFIIFSIAYYFTCAHYDYDFEIEMEEMSKLWEIPVEDTPEGEKEEINKFEKEAVEMNDVVLDEEEYKPDIKVQANSNNIESKKENVNYHTNSRLNNDYEKNNNNINKQSTDSNLSTKNKKLRDSHNNQSDHSSNTQNPNNISNNNNNDDKNRDNFNVEV
jgi:hypothetical protein